MIVYNQQILQTLETLCARHQKIVDDFGKKDPNETSDLNETIQALTSVNALATYNSFKQRYQNI